MPGNIYTVLKCPIYVAKLHHRGGLFPANHPPIIDNPVSMFFSDSLPNATAISPD